MESRGLFVSHSIWRCQGFPETSSYIQHFARIRSIRTAGDIFRLWRLSCLPRLQLDNWRAPYFLLITKDRVTEGPLLPICTRTWKFSSYFSKKVHRRDYKTISTRMPDFRPRQAEQCIMQWIRKLSQQKYFAKIELFLWNTHRKAKTRMKKHVNHQGVGDP